MNWKYLIVEQDDGIPVPVLFSGLLKHVAVARHLPWRVLGAGHVRFAPTGETILVQTFGEAGSLNMVPQDLDETVICEDSRRFRDAGSSNSV